MAVGVYPHYDRSNATEAQLKYWDRLKKNPPAHCFKKGITKWVGKDNHEWQGDNVSYRCLHGWVQKWKGKAIYCQNCGKQWDKPRSIQWANIDHKYRRVLEDYISLCIKCHANYDKENNLRYSYEKENQSKSIRESQRECL